MTPTSRSRSLLRPLAVLAAALLAGDAPAGPAPERPGEDRGGVAAGSPAAERPEPGRGPSAAAPAPKTEMVLVPAGEFLMGTPLGDVSTPPEEKPQHKVTLKAFRIDRLEVSNGDYRKFLAAVARSHPTTCHPAEILSKDHAPDGRWYRDPEWNADEKPVMGIDWYDAYAYCSWAGKRLPTEAEWEKAARGTDGRIFPWGSTFEAGRPYGNFADVSIKKLNPTWTILPGYDDGFAHTAPVGSYPRGVSPYGAEDMAGNVWEWVADWFSPMAYADPNTVDPAGPATGEAKVLRGGSWDSTANWIRTAARHQHFATYRGISFGIRCAQDER